MGEVIKRQKDGKFIGWYIRYYDSDGKRRIKASKQPTYNEARRMLLLHPRAKCEIAYRRSASSGLNRILPFVGALWLNKFRRRDIELARDKLSARYKPNTVCSEGQAPDGRSLLRFTSEKWEGAHAADSKRAAGRSGAMARRLFEVSESGSEMAMSLVYSHLAPSALAKEIEKMKL